MTENEDRFDRQRLIPGWDQEALQRTCFFIAGAGALGNEVAKNLAMLGAKRLVIGGTRLHPAGTARREVRIMRHRVRVR